MAATAINSANTSREGANTQQSEECRVSVAVRIRPSIPGSKHSLTIDPGLPQISTGGQAFTFDHVCGGENGAEPCQLYSSCVAPLVDGLFKGYNATVFAYGQTGSGKTYTMGSEYKPGMVTTRAVIPEAINAIYDKIAAAKDWQCSVHVSFIEIYQEEMRDLLVTTQANRKPLSIREMRNGGVSLRGAVERNVKSKDEMAAVLEMGTASRSTASTNMNQRSSRSHAIFTITLEQWRQVPIGPVTSSHVLSGPATPNTSSHGGALPSPRSSWDFEDGIDVMSNSDARSDIIYDDYLCAKMHLVDLAGSESVKMTKAEGSRLKESTYINKGLLVLGKVINAIADGHKHIPYRESKLTRLLQDALGGNSRTVMIACVSPADVNAKETLNTLKYACHARKISNKPTINRDPVAAQVVSLRCQLADLQRENAILKALTSSVSLTDSQEAQSSESSELAELQFEYKVAQSRIAYLEAQQAEEADQAAAQQQALHAELQAMRQAMDNMVQEHAAQVSNFEAKLRQVREEANQQLVDLRAQLATAQVQQTQSVQTVTADRDNTLAILKEQHAEQIAALQSQHASSINELQKAQKAMIQQLQIGNLTAIQAAKEQMRDEVLQELQQQLQEAIHTPTGQQRRQSLPPLPPPPASQQQQRLKEREMNAMQLNARIAAEQATRLLGDLKQKAHDDRDDMSSIYARSEQIVPPAARSFLLPRPKLQKQIDVYAAKLASREPAVVDLKVNLEVKAKNAAEAAMRYLGSQKRLKAAWLRQVCKSITSLSLALAV